MVQIERFKGTRDVTFNFDSTNCFLLLYRVGNGKNVQTLLWMIHVYMFSIQGDLEDLELTSKLECIYNFKVYHKLKNKDNFWLLSILKNTSNIIYH